MHSEVPLKQGKSPQGVTPEIAFAERKAVGVNGRRTKRSDAHGTIWTSASESTRSIVNCFSTGILSPIQIQRDPRIHVRSHVRGGTVRQPTKIVVQDFNRGGRASLNDVLQRPSACNGPCQPG